MSEPSTSSKFCGSLFEAINEQDCNFTSLILVPLRGKVPYPALRLQSWMIWLKFYAIVLFQMVVIHGDLVKDILFIYVYGRIIETNKKIEIQSLPVQFLLLMAVSIALPILANCILVMPEVSKYGLKSWKALIISTLISPFSPAICLYIRARMATQQHIQCLRFWIKKDRENSEIDEPEVRKHPLMTSPKEGEG